MRLNRLCKLTGLMSCLAGIVPTGVMAAPDMARAAATVSARVLAPASVALRYSASGQQVQLRVSRPNQQVYQLHIGQNHSQSYAQARSNQDYPLPITAGKLKLATNDIQQPPVTVYFN